MNKLKKNKLRIRNGINIKVRVDYKIYHWITKNKLNMTHSEFINLLLRYSMPINYMHSRIS